jgi:hypothetical protein
MSLTVSQVYSVRFGTKLPLPKVVQDNIAKLRIVPTLYKAFRPVPKHGNTRQKYEKPEGVENWREKSLAEYVSKIKDKGDPDYHEIFAILNKVGPSNIQKLGSETIEILRKHNQEFRLRVSTLLFDKAINEVMFASVLADFAVLLNSEFPEIAEDFNMQAKMFTKLYDVNDTLTFPQSSEPEFENKVILWMKQKQRRRGFAKFLTQLFVRNLINEEIMKNAIGDVVAEMISTAKQPKTEQTEENTTQYVDFLFESSKLLPSSSHNLKSLISSTLSECLTIPRTELPSLCMRSRFRMEDTLKCVQ